MHTEPANAKVGEKHRWVITPEESKYVSDVLQKLIDIPMEKRVKYGEGAMFGFADKTYGVVLDEVIITPPDTKHPNWPKTVMAMKYIIDWSMDRVHGFEITFNNNFTKFKKSTLKTK